MFAYGTDQVDLQRLVQILSQPPYYPTSLHLRNHLLAPYAAQPAPPDASQQEPWITYSNYRKGANVVLLGQVPSSIVRDPPSADRHGLWGVAILFPTYSSVSLPDGTQDKLRGDPKVHDIWNNMRLIFWLSSESATSQGTVASKSEEGLIDHIVHDWLPRAVCDLDKKAGSEREATVDLFAVNDVWVKVMARWTEEGDKRLQLTRANPCMTFLKSERDSISAQEIPSRWRVSSLASQNDLELVQSSNNLRYPLWYLDQRKHVSFLIRDGDDSGPSEYPSGVKTGAPAAWAYAHDDLSLASLHVAEPYRRQNLGRLCVEQMAPKLIQAQKKALLLAGCKGADLPTPYLLDTEMHKGASRLFFEAQGFHGFTIATWGSINLCLSTEDV